MTYGEWCPTCGEPITSVTRGIPSIGACKNGHRTDRRDALRREPAAQDGAEVERLRAELGEADACHATEMPLRRCLSCGGMERARKRGAFTHSPDCALARAHEQGGA